MWAAHIDDQIDPDSNSVRVLSPDNSYAGQNPVQPVLFGDLDANNDGNKDVVYVADYSTAAVIVYSPQTSEVLHQFVMDNSSQVILRAAEAGDINADGFDDIFIVILETDSTGAVIHKCDIHSGLDGTLLYRFSNMQSDDGFGASVAPAGDVNGDGYSDILIGAPTGGTIGAGAAYIFSGEDGELIRAHEGSVRGLQLGASVAGVGDVDGDGLADYAVGSPDKDASKVGKVFIYSGGNGDTIQVLVGEDEGTRFGHSIAALRGITSDNRAAIAVAAPDLLVEASGGVVVRRGCVYLYSADGAQLTTLTGEHGYGFALSLNSTSHDGNTDGYNDLMVSALISMIPKILH